MPIDLRTTQEYLNAKAGTVGLTKQQALAYLAGGVAPLNTNPMTGQDAATNYAGAGGAGKSKSEALKQKVGAAASGVDFYGQEAARRL